jgi:fumarate reductase flavoprotein subunit
MQKVSNSELMRDSAAAGAYRRFESWKELAAACGLPPAALDETIERYHAAIRAGADPLGRARLGPALAPPLYAGWITGALAHTQGGLRVDPLGRVQRDAGGAIPGLYAGGGTAAGISGDGGDGYLSANGLLTALGGGWLIGHHLAATLR